MKPVKHDIQRIGEQDLEPEALASIAQALRGLRYGTLTMVVQDGVVVQLERLERTRLRTKPALSSE